MVECVKSFMGVTFFLARTQAQGSLCGVEPLALYPRLVEHRSAEFIICENTTCLKSGVFRWRRAHQTAFLNGGNG